MDVGLIRDLAMGINPDGADSWMNQEAYVSGLRCGAPPDDFQPKGQEWGVLPLDPVRLRRNLAPFAQLLRANMRHAGGLRIDHVIGVQRQFLVPLGAEAKSGCYVRFPFDDLLGVLALESTRNRCLVVGEDLGTVPEGFRQRIHDLNIPGCAVFYFERTHDGRFKPPSDYRRKAAATVSTHDLTPLAGFWEKRDIAQRLAARHLHGERGEDRGRGARRRSRTPARSACPSWDHRSQRRSTSSVYAGAVSSRPCVSRVIRIAAFSRQARRSFGRTRAAQRAGHDIRSAELAAQIVSHRRRSCSAGFARRTRPHLRRIRAQPC